MGQPLGAFHTLRFLGVDPQTGDAMYEDVNGDGEINADDRQIVGSPHPDLTGGLTNTFAWGGLDLSVFVLFSAGSEVFNATRMYADDGGATSDNKLRSVMDRWQQPGDVTDVPRASLEGESGADLISSRFIEDGSFLRLKTVTLGYTVPERLLLRLGGRSARVYVTGQNLLLSTNYTGLDPEVNYNGSGSNVGLGTEFYTVPQPRTLLVGLSLGL